MKLKEIMFFTAAFLLLALSYGFYKSYQPGKVKLKKGDDAPALTLPSPSGKKVSLESFRGKIVLVDFWASWCIPCRQSFPKLKKLYSKYENSKFKKIDGFEIISISVDKDENAWRQAFKEDELPWILLWDGDSKVSDRYGIKRMPTTFLIDQKGVILGKNMYPDDIEWKLTKYLDN